MRDWKALYNYFKPESNIKLVFSKLCFWGKCNHKLKISCKKQSPNEKKREIGFSRFAQSLSDHEIKFIGKSFGVVEFCIKKVIYILQVQFKLKFYAV